MNFGQQVSMVKTLFGDSSGAMVSDSDIKTFLNAAQIDVARRTTYLGKRAQTSSVASDGTYELPDDLLLIKKVTYNGTKLEKIDEEVLDDLNPTADNGSSVGTPTHYYLWGRILHLNPWPESAGSGNIDIWYIKSPAELVDDTDVTELPANCHEDMVKYALALCKEVDDDYNAVANIRSEYELRLTSSTQEANDPYEDSYPAVRDIG